MPAAPLHDAMGEVGRLTRLWQRVPLVLRATIAGAVVLTAGGLFTGPLIVANGSLWPHVPWSCVGLLGWMGVFWQYAGGRWWPKSTAQARRGHLRAHQLSAEVWCWALGTGAFGVLCSLSLQWAVARLVPLHHAIPGVLQPFPPISLLAIVLTLSSVAGVVEEAAFRGYMQTPIEARHGRTVAILLVSVLFGVAHLPDWQPDMTWARMGFILAAGVFYGLLATTVGSILPGVVIHAVGNMVGILWIWWLSTGRVEDPAPKDLGPILADPRFGIACFVSIVAALGAVWSFDKLLTARARERQA